MIGPDPKVVVTYRASRSLEVAVIGFTGVMVYDYKLRNIREREADT